MSPVNTELSFSVLHILIFSVKFSIVCQYDLPNLLLSATKISSADLPSEANFTPRLEASPFNLLTNILVFTFFPISAFCIIQYCIALQNSSTSSPGLKDSALIRSLVTQSEASLSSAILLYFGQGANVIG